MFCRRVKRHSVRISNRQAIEGWIETTTIAEVHCRDLVAFLFPVAYVLSGLAGLVYEVSWTRLLTLYIGHTTAAASAVVAAFLGGMALGAFIGGRGADRLSPRGSLKGYVLLELSVAALALALPYELAALSPVLASAYRDGNPGWLFPVVRLVACTVMVFVPALALGATFPLAVRWFTAESPDPARMGSPAPC